MQKQKLTAALLQNYLLENKLDKSWKNDIYSSGLKIALLP